MNENSGEGLPAANAKEGDAMRIAAALGLRMPERRVERRAEAPSTTATMRALCDLGESIATNVHAIYTATRLYLCVTMEPKPDALEAQLAADKRLAAGLFEVDRLWSAASVNARWARKAVLTDGEGQLLDAAVLGARGMTDAGAKEVFFEFSALDAYPERMYLSSGDTRVRVR